MGRGRRWGWRDEQRRRDVKERQELKVTDPIAWSPKPVVVERPEGCAKAALEG